MSLCRKRRVPEPGPPEHESDPTSRLPRPPPMAETASPAQMRRTFRPPSQRNSRTPPVPKELVNSIEESSAQARKRARTATTACDKILKALAEQALNVMADKGMTPERSSEKMSPPLSPRSFYRRVGLDFDSPMSAQVTKAKPEFSTLNEEQVPFTPDVQVEIVPARTPLRALPLTLTNVTNETTDKVSVTSSNEVLKLSVGSKALTGDSNPSETPARVQAARCLLSFSK